MLDQASLLAALRGERDADELCRAAGISRAELDAARDAELQRRLPPAEARLQAAVRGPVEILRDRAGVPHVYADTTADLYFGLGFATAQDRLWQMDRLRRRALGRQAEVLGAEYLPSDLLHRAVGIPELAAAEVERLDEATRVIVEAYAAGVNRAIEAHGALLPIEFALLDYEPEPFSARDVVATLRGLWWSLNGRLDNLVIGEAARVLPDEALRQAFLTPEAPEARIVPPGSPFPASDLPLVPPHDLLVGAGDASGSNNWAISGRRTASGRAILCSDPHQPFWLPSSWYEYALHGPEDDAAGAGHPGVPGLWFGSNGDAAWGITNNNASTRDLYEEELHPEDSNRYRDGDTWRRFAEREIEIQVRGQPPARRRQLTSVRGPLVGDLLPSVDPAGNPPLSLRWVGHEHLDDVRALVAIGRARTWPSFRAALRDWAVAVFNFVYADVRGFVGYQCAGRVPLRGRVTRGFRAANQPLDAWRGYVPFDALPRLEDPPSGYVASANERVAPDDYPYPFYGPWAGGHRSARIRQALGGREPLSIEQSVALQNDVKGCRPERLIPPLLRHLERSSDPDTLRLREILAAWDFRYAHESSAPTLFEALMQAWQERVAAARFPPHLLGLLTSQGGAAARLIERDDLPWFPAGQDTSALLAGAAEEALARLRAQLGPEPADWPWGKVHLADWRHPLSSPPLAPASDVGPAPVDGSGETVRNTGSGPNPPFGATTGAEYRLVVDFSRPRELLAVQNVGQSGEPGSPHYRDQFTAWLAGQYHTVHLDRVDVERDLWGHTRLEPRQP